MRPQHHSFGWVQSHYKQLGHEPVIQWPTRGAGVLRLMGGPEIDQVGLGSRLWYLKKCQKIKKKEMPFINECHRICKNNCSLPLRELTNFIHQFLCISSLWVPADSFWQSLIIAGLSLITSQNARLPCQTEAFSPAVSMVCLRHTSKHDWCEESCQIRLNGFPPLPPAQLHVHGWGHRPRPPEPRLYCWGLTD